MGRGELNARQQMLGLHLNRIGHMAEEFNITVFMTNQVQSDPGASALFAGGKAVVRRRKSFELVLTIAS